MQKRHPLEKLELNVIIHKKIDFGITKGPPIHSKMEHKVERNYHLGTPLWVAPGTATASKGHVDTPGSKSLVPSASRPKRGLTGFIDLAVAHQQLENQLGGQT